MATGRRVTTVLWCCFDEGSHFKNSSLFDSLRYATIARPNGLLLCISTASDDVTGWYHGIYQKSKRVLSGEDLDTTHYAEVYESLPDADYEDVAEWYKACPSLGTSFSEQSLRNDLEAAKTDPVELLRWLRYRLNRWTRLDDLAYFDVVQWDKWKTSEPDCLTDCECWLSADLSLTTDPSSVGALWKLPDGRLYAKCFGWVCREGVKLRERTSLTRYQDLEAGTDCFRITDGDMIDHDGILSFLIELCERYNVQSVAFDPTSAVVLMNRLNSATGVEVVRIPQTYRYFSVPLQALRQAIQAGKVLHDGNQWLRYCLSCVRIEENSVGELRPSTKKSTDHIDGAVALLLAYHQLLHAEETVTKTGVIRI